MRFSRITGRVVIGSLCHVYHPSRVGALLMLALAIALAGCGDSDHDNGVLPCTLGPNSPTTPVPADAAIDIATAPHLSWGAGDSYCSGLVTTYDVYLGTDPSPGANQLLGSVNGKSWDPDSLALNITYYWKVVARDGNGSASSPVWRFTTGEVTLDNAIFYPTGLEVVHTPSSVTAMEAGPSGLAYSWVFQTTVRAVAGFVTVKAFGCYTLSGHNWILGNYTGAPFTGADFASWYSCPDSVVVPSQSYSDPSNWAGSSGLEHWRGLWVYVGRDASGQPVKGQAVVELLGELGRD
jgi:hypothetical protein